MKKTTFYALAGMITSALLGFTSTEPTSSDGKTPPGTVSVSANFFADKNEICNIDYNEYLFWLAHVLGKESEEYANAQLDKSVWEGFPNKENYFEHPDYAQHPVVGITLEQAEKYTVWRTDRVAEKLLMGQKLIAISPDQNRSNYFSVERYKTGGFDWIIKKQEVAIPVFRIPSQQEWELIAKGNSSNEFGTDSQSSYNKKVLRKNYNRLYNTRKDRGTAEINKTCDGPAARTDYAKNVNGLWHIIGNVAELVTEPGIAKGGSWKDNSKDCIIQAVQKVDGPNNWTGFRNISAWEIIKI